MAAQPDPAFVAQVFVEGTIYSAWESLTIKCDYGKGISVFAFAPVEGAYGVSYRGLRIKPGNAVAIKLAGQQAFLGWVKERVTSYDKQSHQIVITGESMTTDLAHASAVVQPGGLDGSTIAQAVRSVLAPHPIGLVLANLPPVASIPFERLAIQYGEKCFEFIERLATSRNLFISDDVNGNLVLSQGSPTPTPSAQLVEGRNILRATGKLLDPSACIWNKFNGTSQTAATDSSYPTRDNSATVLNPSIRSNLFGLFTAEQPMSAQELVGRVQHATMQALWPTVDVTITVPGWLRPDGKLWATAPDDSAYVSVFSPMLFPDVDGPVTLGIQGITFQQDSSSGTTTTLHLVRPDALSHAPISDLVGGAGTTVNTTPQPDSPDWKTST